MMIEVGPYLYLVPTGTRYQVLVQERPGMGNIRDCSGILTTKFHP
jgi:hypothetical protein